MNPFRDISRLVPHLLMLCTVLSLFGATEPEAIATLKVRGIKKGDTLNVRAEPTADSQVVAQLRNSDLVQIRGTAITNGTTEWTPIAIGTQVGWVSKIFLQEVDADAEHSPSSPDQLTKRATPSQLVNSFFNNITKTVEASLDPTTSASSATSNVDQGSNPTNSRVSSNNSSSHMADNTETRYLENEGLRFIDYFATGRSGSGMVTSRKFRNLTGKPIRAFRATLYKSDDFGEVTKLFDIEYISETKNYKPIEVGEVFYLCTGPDLPDFYSNTNPVLGGFGAHSDSEIKSMFSEYNIKQFSFKVNQIAFVED